MKKIVVFFTNQEKIKNVLRGKPIIEIPEDDNIQISVKDCNDCEVYILHDNTTYDINTLLDSSSKGYYVYHSRTENTYKKLNIPSFTGKEDRHEPASNPLAKGYYLWLNKVDLEDAGNGNKKFVSEISKDLFDELWNKLNENTKFETSLNFLHQLNNGEKPENLPEDLSEFSEEYDAFKKSTGGNIDVFSEAYIKALAKFRDAVLDSVIEN